MQAPSVQSLLFRFPEAEVEASPDGPVGIHPVKVGGEERPSLYAPAPSRVRFRSVAIPRGAHLVFGIGLIDSTIERETDGTLFRVAVAESSGAAEPIWSRALPFDGEKKNKRWRDVDIDLSRFAGREVDLLLETRRIGDHANGWGAWSMPVIRSGPSDSEDAWVPAGPITVLEVERDLLGKTAPPIGLGTFTFVGRGDSAQILQDHIRSLEGHGVSSESVTDPSSGLLSFRIEVPEGGVLELAGEVLKAPDSHGGRLGPVDFSASIEGRELYRRTLATGGTLISFAAALPVFTFSGISFTQSLSLDEYAGRVVDLTLRIEDRGGRESISESIAWWTGALLMRSRPVPRRTSGKNVLLVLVDTLRADHLGVYGYERDVSPELDGFGAQALVFDRAIAQSPWTQPSTATLLTGLFPLQHGVVGAVPLAHQIETLAQAMQRDGFMTFGLSTNPIIGRREGFHRGFGNFVEVPWGRAAAVREVFDAWLDENSGVPWFAYLHYVDPHSPFDAPEPFGSAYVGDYRGPLVDPKRVSTLLAAIESGEAQGEDAVLSEQDIAFVRARYDGEIRYWDSEFGKLLGSLERRGVLDETVIVVVGDHGEEFFEHGKIYHGEQLYDESIHVPLMIRAPGLVDAGRSAGLVEVRAVMETVLDLLDVRSVRPSDSTRATLLAGGDSADAPAFSHTALAFSHGYGYRQLASVTQGGWKYIRRLDDGSAELYRLTDDPGETRNLLESEPEAVDRLRSLLDHHLAQVRSSSGAVPDPGMLEKLRALGYIQ